MATAFICVVLIRRLDTRFIHESMQSSFHPIQVSDGMTAALLSPFFWIKGKRVTVKGCL